MVEGDPDELAQRLMALGFNVARGRDYKSNGTADLRLRWAMSVPPRYTLTAEAKVEWLTSALTVAERWLTEMHCETVEGVKNELRDEHSAAWAVIDMLRDTLAKAAE